MITCLVVSAIVFAQTTDVYVGGNNNGKATVWKNGTAEHLADGGEIYSVVVVGEDVYAVGKDAEFVAKVWKNGTVLHTLSGYTYMDIFITSMVVSGDDIYVTTHELTETWQSIGRLWKNGVEQSGYEDATELMSVFVDGDDIYVAGKTLSQAVVWKNASKLYTYVSEVAESFVSVIVAEGDVYYMGGDYGGAGKNTIIKKPSIENTGKDITDLSVNVWKNDEILYVLGSEVYGGDLCFSKGVLYAIGQAPGGGVYQAKIWVDGVGTVLSNAWSGAESIFVFNDDVYVAGFYGSYPELNAAVWKNGDEILIATGGYNMANSVFVTGETVGISNVNNVNLEIYPNPVKDILQIENNKLQINKVEIIDLTGKVIYQFNNMKNQINVSDLSQGIYFVKLETDKGIVTKKFVKN